jgi:hypothetical protein
MSRDKSKEIFHVMLDPSYLDLLNSGRSTVRVTSKGDAIQPETWLVTSAKLQEINAEIKVNNVTIYSTFRLTTDLNYDDLDSYMTEERRYADEADLDFDEKEMEIDYYNTFRIEQYVTTDLCPRAEPKVETIEYTDTDVGITVDFGEKKKVRNLAVEGMLKGTPAQSKVLGNLGLNKTIQSYLLGGKKTRRKRGKKKKSGKKKSKK